MLDRFSTKFCLKTSRGPSWKNFNASKNVTDWSKKWSKNVKKWQKRTFFWSSLVANPYIKCSKIWKFSNFWISTKSSQMMGNDKTSVQERIFAWNFAFWCVFWRFRVDRICYKYAYVDSVLKLGRRLGWKMFIFSKISDVDKKSPNDGKWSK